jgi:hypothetical protein
MCIPSCAKLASTSNIIDRSKLGAMAHVKFAFQKPFFCLPLTYAYAMFQQSVAGNQTFWGIFFIICTLFLLDFDQDVQFLLSYTLHCGIHKALVGVFWIIWHVFGVGSRCKEDELLGREVKLAEMVLLLCLPLLLED